MSIPRPITPAGRPAHIKGTTMDLDRIFSYHPPNPETHDLERYAAIRDAGKAFAQVILQTTPKGADQNAAIRKVREAVMTANSAVALKGTL